MSKHVHPYSHRLGILRDWKSRWFTKGAEYRSNLKADVLVREFLAKKLKTAYINSIDIERGRGAMKIYIQTSRPGVVIGRSGEGTAKLKEEILKKMRKIGALAPKEIIVEIQELRSPESHAAIVAQAVVEQLEKRMQFRRILKQTVEKAMANRDVKGVKVSISGRLGGADMSRRESLKKGRIPLQTLRADVDYAMTRAHLPYGHLGVKVWIYRGDIFDRDANITKKQ
jgi:small subunit ribosomal protein S3